MGGVRLHNRVVKAEFWRDTELIRALPIAGRMLYEGLWQLADDSGCILDDPWEFKLHLFPLDADITPEQVAQWRDTMVELGKLIPYEANGKTCLYLKNFHKHQSLRSPGGPESAPLPPWIDWAPADKKGRTGTYTVRSPYELATNSEPDSYGDQARGSFDSDSDSEPEDKTMASPDGDGEAEAETIAPTEVKPKRTPKTTGEAKQATQHLKDRLKQRGVTVFAKDWHIKANAVAQAMLATGLSPPELIGYIDRCLDDPFWGTRTTTMDKVRDLVMQWQQEGTMPAQAATSRNGKRRFGQRPQEADWDNDEELW